MSSNVIPFPKRGMRIVEEPEVLPTISGIPDLISGVTDWAENNNVDVYDAEFIYFCADFMQRLQLLAYKAAA